MWKIRRFLTDLSLHWKFLTEEEGYEKYDEMVQALAKLNDIVVQAKKDIVPDAIKWAWEFKDDSVIYTMGSGACWGPAHQEAICIFMEMQWINASVIHSGEFFHGPFEITDKNTAFLMMKSCGHTRPLDDRALDFIKKFNNRIFVLDASQYGINELGELAEYLEPMFYNNVIGVFNNLIADARKHPLTTRRYMWKFPY